MNYGLRFPGSILIYLLPFLSPCCHVRRYWPFIVCQNFQLTYPLCELIFKNSNVNLCSLHQFYVCIYFLYFFCLFPLRSRRQTSQPESKGAVTNQNWVGGGNHSCEVQQHHPDLGWGATGGTVAYNVLQWQNRKVASFLQTEDSCCM